MAENLNKVNGGLVYIFIFLNAFAWGRSGEELVPVLIWTSSDFQIRKNADFSGFDKIQSDLFQFYISELLGNNKAAVVVFLEQVLDTEDFDWKDDEGNNSFPFLTQLTIASELNYFREVETPHQTLTSLSKRGYIWKHAKPDQRIAATEGDLILIEFRNIDDRRPETLKSHDRTMEKISQELTTSGGSWICIYTGRHSHRKGFFPDKKLSSWHAEEQLAERSTKAISLYHDEHTGFALLTRKCIELQVPSSRHTITKPLDNYLRASATSYQKKVSFVIWFTNYKLTFYLTRGENEWTIKEAKIVNDNGDVLDLKEQQQMTNKCYNHLAEFRSREGPAVKITLLKYKFLKLPQHEPCAKPYGVELLATFIFFLVVFAVTFWNSVLDNYDFAADSKVSSDKVLTFKFERMRTL